MSDGLRLQRLAAAKASIALVSVAPPTIGALASRRRSATDLGVVPADLAPQVRDLQSTAINKIVEIMRDAPRSGWRGFHFAHLVHRRGRPALAGALTRTRGSRSHWRAPIRPSVGNAGLELGISVSSAGLA